MSGKGGAQDDIGRLIDAHVDDLLAMPEEEVLAEARAEGIDLDAQKAHVMDLFDRAERKVGQARMAAARAGIAARRARPPGKSPAPTTATDALAVTLAARNGSGQSDRDKESLNEDLDELARFHFEKPEE